jgi:hypothetical protein
MPVAKVKAKHHKLFLGLLVDADMMIPPSDWASGALQKLRMLSISTGPPTRFTVPWLPKETL